MNLQLTHCQELFDKEVRFLHSRHQCVQHFLATGIAGFHRQQFGIFRHFRDFPCTNAFCGSLDGMSSAMPDHHILRFSQSFEIDHGLLIKQFKNFSFQIPVSQ